MKLVKALTGVVAVAAVGGAVAAAVGFGGKGTGTPARSTQPPATAEVARETLVDYKSVDGTLSYGEESTVNAHGQGTYTWLPAAGTSVDRGKALYRVDDKPVPLLYGSIPLYRRLAPGVSGADVKQFEENLRALGYTGFTVDNDYTSATADAVKRWQHALGLTENGTIDLGQVGYLSGAARVAQLKAHVGDQAGGPAYTVTGSTRLVSIDLDVSLQRLAVAGSPVTVTLPGGKAVKGKIATVGTVATQQNNQNNGQPTASTIKVTVSLDDQNQLGTLDQAPVDVKLVAEQRKDVLTVPVAALLALAEGGYGVEVVDGGSERVVAVETGMFANGRVEVSGGGLNPGTKVGVPK